jgi:CRISPR-associated protein Csx10
MHRAALILTLSADAVFSARSATLGGHDGLDHIPGAALLGWAAGRLYRNAAIDAYTFFHSGKVRFGNGFPLTESGKVAFPIPQVLRERKQKRNGVENGKLAPAELRIQPAEFDDGAQAEVLKKLHVTADGEVIKRHTGYRMKTAIKDGRSAEAQLFGYENLQAGRKFLASVEADDDVPEDAFNAMLRQFDNKTLNLGRSRRAEYGGEIHCRVERSSGAETLPGPSGGASSRLTLWLLSDLALDDENGAPSLAPSSRLLGLPDGRFCERRSVISVRRYAPFNGYLRRSELERSVIAAGSVLCYELGSPFAPAASDFAGGFGLYREAGLGRAWINPPMLEGREPRLGAAAVIAIGDEARREARPSVYATNLLNWLQASGSRSKFAAECDDLPENWLSEVKKFYDTARRRGSAVTGPSSAQWGRVKTLCDSAEITPESFKRQLIDDKNAICTGQQWDVEDYFGAKSISLRGWMKAKLDEKRWLSNHETLRQTLGRLAELARPLGKEQ